MIPQDKYPWEPPPPLEPLPSSHPIAQRKEAQWRG